LPKKDDSDSHLTKVAALSPLKVARVFWELNLTDKGFDCGSWLTLVPREIVDPIEKVAADVAAILDSCETKNNAGLISLKN
jgi:hypothetical protein